MPDADYFNKVLDNIRELLKNKKSVYINHNTKVNILRFIKLIDPDCETVNLSRVYLTGLNNSFSYLTGNLLSIEVKPFWLKRIELKCKMEPDKLHILFFDELTKTHKTEQHEVYEIAKYKIVNGKWKLPENARVVTAGDLNDVFADNLLFQYFEYVDISSNDKLQDFLSSSNIKPSNKFKNNTIIHPFIITFLLYKGYDFDKKWEKSSRELYNCCNIYSLNSFVEMKQVIEFMYYFDQRTISIEDIVNDNYTDKEIEDLSNSQKYYLIATLSSVADKDMEKARQFINKFGPGMLELFDAVCGYNYKKIIEIAKNNSKNEYYSALLDFIRNEYHFMESDKQNGFNIHKTNYQGSFNDKLDDMDKPSKNK